MRESKFYGESWSTEATCQGCEACGFGRVRPCPSQSDAWWQTARAASREVDFGVWWREPKATGGYDTGWRLTWVEATGEVYRTKDGEVFGMGQVADEATIEKLLEGWADRMTTDDLDWVRDQLDELSAALSTPPRLR
jgi:hypothetical protein